MEGYIEESYRDLRFAFVLGELDLKQFKVYLSEELVLPGARIAQAYVIGESHVLSLNLGEPYVTIHEVLACTQFNTGGFNKSIRYRAEQLQDGLEIRLPPWRYAVRVTYEQGGYKNCPELHGITEGVTRSHGKLTLRYEFPTKEGLGEIPLTCVQLQSHSQGIEWQSTHTYPNEGWVVRSNSFLRKEATVQG